MTELTKGAERQLKTYLGKLEKEMRVAGHPGDEINSALAGVREQILDMAPGGDEITEAQLAETLHSLDAPEDWGDTLPTSTMGGLGPVALFVSLLTVFGMITGSGLADAAGADGGAVFATIALFGFAASIILGVMSRHTQTGKAALIICAMSTALFLLAALLLSGEG